MEEINNIIWSPRSKANIKEIHEYISEYSQKKADSFLNDVIHSVEDLMAFPKMYRQAEEYNDPNIREFFFKKKYRLIYRIIERNIEIITVRDARRLML